ncbi:Clock-controlled protein 6 [Colletotrichum shisoi]|uniref:Clock-controlled protein 6 n=1 Tax=Colletotrichum shisoi TaxID=2078593 RepID=A0A5Q4BD86_9PEZI|nr:Clock-controlled protein 6 [Colletotrichum shisoi]
MKFSQLVSAAGLVTCAQAGGTDARTIYTAVITTAYETYCPSPTTFIHQNVTYTATSATTLTITNCPCTITTHQPPPYTTTKTIYPPPAVNTTVVPPPVLSTTIKTIKTPPPKPTYHNTTVIEHTPKPPKTTEYPPHTETVTPKPPKPSHHSNVTSTVVIVVTPPAVTNIGHTTPVAHTTPVTELPSRTPVGPSTTRPVTVPGSGAGALTASAGAVVLAGLFALLV